jgi:hypothetical protein
MNRKNGRFEMARIMEIGDSTPRSEAPGLLRYFQGRAAAINALIFEHREAAPGAARFSEMESDEVGAATDAMLSRHVYYGHQLSVRWIAQSTDDVADFRQMFGPMNMVDEPKQ